MGYREGQHRVADRLPGRPVPGERRSWPDLSRPNRKWRSAGVSQSPQKNAKQIQGGRGGAAAFLADFLAEPAGWPVRARHRVTYGWVMQRQPRRAEAVAESPLSADELRKMDAYWRASNYLSVGQIYLLDNPLLREPLKREHVKPRLLGHWGTSPGLNFLYVHLNRVIVEHDLNMMYIIGPGHGGPSLVALAYLEGTYSEVYPSIDQTIGGMKRLFKQFSFPGGIPSHVAPETPGSIHEGGELGYALSHAYGAAFDNPDLIVACVVGDGEAETGPLATGWHGNKFLNPARDGAVLPILHLNGYKIANPCFLARIPKDELQKFFEGMGYAPYFVEGRDPKEVHQQLADVLDMAVAEIKQNWATARAKGAEVKRPAWPM